MVDGAPAESLWRIGLLQSANLVAKPGGLRVIFHIDRMRELASELIEHVAKWLALHFTPPAHEEAKFIALFLVFFLLVVTQETAYGVDSVVDGGECLAVIAGFYRERRLRAGAHHLHVRPESVKLHLVSL